MKFAKLIAVCLFLWISVAGEAQEFKAIDYPWDNGSALLLRWQLDPSRDSLSLQKPDSSGVYREFFNEFSQSGECLSLIHI